MKFCLVEFLFLLGNLSMNVSNGIADTNLRKYTSEDSFDIQDYLIDKVAKYLPDNILQDGASLIKNVVMNKFDLSKPLGCEFRCPNGSN